MEFRISVTSVKCVTLAGSNNVTRFSESGLFCKETGDVVIGVCLANTTAKQGCQGRPFSGPNPSPL